MRGCLFCLYYQLRAGSMETIPLVYCYCTFFNERLSKLGYEYIEGCENYVAVSGGDA